VTKCTAIEEENLKRAAALADKSTALRSEVRGTTATVRKFLGHAKEGIASVHKGLSDLALDIEHILVAISPLEDSITALQLAQHRHSLLALTQRQETLLEAEAQRHQ
jgi:hypothetical protein